MGLAQWIKGLFGSGEKPPERDPRERVCPVGRCQITLREAQAGAYCLCDQRYQGLFENAGRVKHGPDKGKRRYRRIRSFGRIVPVAAVKALSTGPCPAGKAKGWRRVEAERLHAEYMEKLKLEGER